MPQIKRRSTFKLRIHNLGEFESWIQIFIFFILNIRLYEVIFIFLCLLTSLFSLLSSDNSVQGRNCAHPVSSIHGCISRGGHHDLQGQFKYSLQSLALVSAEIWRLPYTPSLWHIQTGFWSPSWLLWQSVWDLLLSRSQQLWSWRCGHLFLSTEAQ